MRKYFRVVSGKENDGRDWTIAYLGREAKDDKEYSITTNSVKGSELDYVSKGAKGDAELICELLNLYYNDKIKLQW